MMLADLVRRVLGPEVPITVRAYDGSEAGPPDAVATVVVNRPEALQRFVTAPGELGLGAAVGGNRLSLITETRRLAMAPSDVRHEWPD